MQMHAQTHRQVGGLRLLVRPEGRLQLGVGPLGDHPCGGQRRHRGGMLVIRRAHRRPDRVGLAGQPIPIVVRPQLQSQRALVTGGGQLTAQLVLPLLGQRHRGRRRLGVGSRRGDRVSDSGHPSRRAHPGQHGQIVVQRGQRRRGLPCGDPGRRQLRHRLGHRGRQLGHPLHPGVGLGQRLVVHAGQPGEHLVDRLQPGLRLRGARCRLLLHVLIDAEAQQVDQDLLPRRRLGVQEVGELPLWQHHTAGELLVRQPDRLQHRLLHLGGGAGHHLAEVVRAQTGVQFGHVEAGRHQLQPGVRGLHVAPAVPADHPGRHVTGAAGLEDQPHPRLGRRRRERVRQPSGTTPARHHAVEGEADRVQHCRLTRTGRADQREEVGVGEVDCGLVPEDREPGHVQPHRTHQCSTSSKSSSKSSRTPSSAWPRLSR
ncbi:hypothetical protein ONO23_04693 [Micromonospora noduli]|nr:hypothetical protein ONO23_04693 [Micromonospora noduli]